MAILYRACGLFPYLVIFSLLKTSVMPFVKLLFAPGKSEAVVLRFLLTHLPVFAGIAMDLRQGCLLGPAA